MLYSAFLFLTRMIYVIKYFKFYLLGLVIAFFIVGFIVVARRGTAEGIRCLMYYDGVSYSRLAFALWRFLSC